MSTAARYWLFVDAGMAAISAGSRRLGYQHLAAAANTLPPISWKGIS